MECTNDVYIIHHDTKHRVMCEKSNSPNFKVGSMYSAIRKENSWVIQGEKEEGEVSHTDFEGTFYSVITQY